MRKAGARARAPALLCPLPDGKRRARSTYRPAERQCAALACARVGGWVGGSGRPCTFSMECIALVMKLWISYWVSRSSMSSKEARAIAAVGGGTTPGSAAVFSHVPQILRRTIFP